MDIGTLRRGENSGRNGYQWLKRDLANGVFKPGEKLPVRQLQERYNLSTGPLREALSQLVAERWVSATSHKGFRVALQSLDELQDIYKARANLEVMIVRLAIERGNDAWEASALSHFHTLSKALEIDDHTCRWNAWDTRQQEFHSAIASGCNSKHLLQVRSYLLDQAERYRHLWLNCGDGSQTSLVTRCKEHSALLTAVLNRCPEEACELIRAHLLIQVASITDADLGRSANQRSE